MRISKDIFNLKFYNKDMSLTKNSKIILSSFEDKRYYMDSLKFLWVWTSSKKKKIVALIKEPRVPRRKERKEKESQKKLWNYLKRKRN